MDGKWSGG
ncbi:hypothetical protein CGLO_03135 [Colletotrichum gloeosporioides Cg-14]|uniref:Uncharacterized protein n=1 Tax=Colletotrichum gloeosporioides (strain Cg-14) TaxID=1237896 RepID=T0KX89_COLGC|nr:hypothetical protein CGLO_03135 [Colletotrichum gloeosporioides Cg-14]